MGLVGLHKFKQCSANKQRLKKKGLKFVFQFNVVTAGLDFVAKFLSDRFARSYVTRLPWRHADARCGVTPLVTSGGQRSRCQVVRPLGLTLQQLRLFFGNNCRLFLLSFRKPSTPRRLPSGRTKVASGHSWPSRIQGRKRWKKRCRNTSTRTQTTTTWRWWFRSVSRCTLQIFKGTLLFRFVPAWFDWSTIVWSWLVKVIRVTFYRIRIYRNALCCTFIANFSLHLRMFCVACRGAQNFTCRLALATTSLTPSSGKLADLPGKWQLLLIHWTSPLPQMRSCTTSISKCSVHRLHQYSFMRVIKLRKFSIFHHKAQLFSRQELIIKIMSTSSRYRRSYDSEYTAPLVNHHIWPCLVQGARVVVKGEACTRRGASMVSIFSHFSHFFIFTKNFSFFLHFLHF